MSDESFDRDLMPPEESQLRLPDTSISSVTANVEGLALGEQERDDSPIRADSYIRKELPKGLPPKRTHWKNESDSIAVLAEVLTENPFEGYKSMQEDSWNKVTDQLNWLHLSFDYMLTTDKVGNEKHFSIAIVLYRNVFRTQVRRHVLDLITAWKKRNKAESTTSGVGEVRLTELQKMTASVSDMKSAADEENRLSKNPRKRKLEHDKRAGQAMRAYAMGKFEAMAAGSGSDDDGKHTRWQL